ncbi:hypothetical protein BRADI_3g17830v3 [Brachypodium distachyon]|uniref:Uncharacterized protein n=1 Tax=Brachypodium distachyon TaxID=15368 RepID=I1I1W7_BRADI|nr:hypothetical protein BRADI_3g17830v3 [Brachypodium distachyon]
MDRGTATLSQLLGKMLLQAPNYLVLAEVQLPLGLDDTNTQDQDGHADYIDEFGTTRNEGVPIATTPLQQKDQPRQQLQDFWINRMAEIEQISEFKTHSLPLARPRIKKIMKAATEKSS